MSPSATVEQRHGMNAVVLKVDGAEAEVLPERGALVSRWVVGGDEVLYLDPATVTDRSKNVRGGVPVLFPVAGRVKGPLSFGGKAIALEQHGFARKRAFEVTERSADDATARVAMRLSADEQTRAVFPFAFTFDVVVTLEATRLTVELVVKNTGNEAMPLHLGTHPYFRVPVEAKPMASVKATAGRAFDLLTGNEAPWVAPRLDGPEVNAHLLDAEPSATLNRGDGHRVQCDSSPQMHGLVFWTTPGQPFVCVEPWSDPVDTFGKRALAPSETARFASAFTFS
jgi:galactose mutarotase-like enzyme